MKTFAFLAAALLLCAGFSGSLRADEASSVFSPEAAFAKPQSPEATTPPGT